MRPNQQNNKNRSRGRNNNGGRKHVNPLSRNYESNGPDVKVRGNASHIAEKYQQLARDAQSTGDSVMAENYLQHAEHYYRIVMAAQPQTVRPEFGQDDSDDADDSDGNVGQRQQGQQERGNGPAREEREPAQARQKSTESNDEPVAAVAEKPAAEAAPAAAEPESSGETQEEAPRKRRPRRRRPAGEAAAEGGGDTATKAEGGDLPAFITSGTAAAE